MKPLKISQLHTSQTQELVPSFLEANGIHDAAGVSVRPFTPASPANPEAAQLYTEDVSQYNRKVRPDTALGSPVAS